MPNIIDYIEWRGDLPIVADGFNDIDSLIISQIAMINFKDIVPPPFEEGKISIADAASIYFSDDEKSACSLGLIIPPETKELFIRAGSSLRFGAMKLSSYVSYTNVEEQTQFAALTVDIGDGSCYVAFRGTDDTIVGWKEDFNLSFLTPIPAQTEALKYLEATAAKTSGGIRVGGHSKGGNLSVYSAVKCDSEIKKRIIEVYNNDGPGFSREFLSAPEYEEISDKIKTIVPQSSVVGMLFENKGDYHIVKSAMNGILQHNPFSWELVGNKFVNLDSLTEDGKSIAKVMNDLMAKLNVEERQKVVDAVYDILVATEATTLTELNKDKYAIVRALKDADKETRKVVFGVFGVLLEQGGKLFRNSLFAPLMKREKENKLNEGEKSDFEHTLEEAAATFKEIGEGNDIPEIRQLKDAEPVVNKNKKQPLEPVRQNRHQTKVYPGREKFMARVAIATRKAVIKRIKK